MPILFADAETACELDLKAVGSQVYVRKARTLLWSLRDLDWPRSLVFEQPAFWPLLLEIRRTKQIEWPSGEKLTIVHWSPFDRDLIDLEEVPEGIEVEWIDLQAVSLSYGGPALLAPAARWWGGVEMKDDGKHLIARFCKPQKKTGKWIHPKGDPIRWERFRSYAGQDTNVMVPIYEKFVELSQPGAGGHTWRAHKQAWGTIKRMNDRGVPIARRAAQAAIAACQAQEYLLVEECKRTYGIEPSQTEAVRKRLGLADVQKDTLEDALDVLPTGVRRLAEIRLETAGAARKKLSPMLQMSTPDDPRVRGAFRYHGAWTRRLSSRGLQVQNFVREKSDPAFFRELESGQYPEDIFAAVRRNIRGFIAAEPESVLVAADLAQIELRVGAWLAGEDWLLDALARGEDAYRITAARIFGVPIEDVKKPSRERDFGKVVELGSMFQLGEVGLQRQTAAAKIEITLDDAVHAKNVWRSSHPAFVAAWDEMKQAFLELTDSAPGNEIRVLGGKCSLERWSTHIRLVRPSRFAQYFWCPSIEKGRWPDGGPRDELAYIGLDYQGMNPQRTYGGNIFQGAVQGTAADLMIEALIRAEQVGFHPIMSIHDEIVCEQGDDGESYVDRLCELMSEAPQWAWGLPIEAEGWQGPRFTKA